MDIEDIKHLGMERSTISITVSRNIKKDWKNLATGEPISTFDQDLRLAVIKQNDIDIQEDSNQTLVSVEGGYFSNDLPNGVYDFDGLPFDLYKNSASIEFFDDDNNSTNFGEDIWSECITGNINYVTQTFTFIFLFHGNQSHVVDIIQQEGYKTKLLVEIEGYPNLKFYQKMALLSVQSTHSGDFRNSFIFARVAYEGWLSETVIKNNKGWEDKFKMHYYPVLYSEKGDPKASAKQKLKNISNCDEFKIIKSLGMIRNDLVHGNAGKDEVSTLLSAIDTFTQLELIGANIKQIKIILEGWKKGVKVHKTSFESSNFVTYVRMGILSRLGTDPDDPYLDKETESGSRANTDTKIN